MCLIAKEEGNRLFKDGKYSEAVCRYREAYNQGGEDAKLALLANIAFCHFKLEQWNECVRVASEALLIDPKHSKCLYRRGIGFRNLGDHTAALVDLRAASVLAPDDPVVTAELNKLITFVTAFLPQLPDDVWGVVSSFLSTESKLAVALNHFSRYSLQDKCIVNALKAKTGFTTMAALAADVWQYNRPELQNVLGDIRSLSLDLKGYRLCTVGSKVVGHLKRVLAEYIKGLDIPLWKYLPRGMRCNYDKYLEPLPRHKVMRYANPIFPKKPHPTFHLCPAAVDISAPRETKPYPFDLNGSDPFSRVSPRFHFTRDDILVTYPVFFRPPTRIVEITTGAAADFKEPNAELWPSRRMVLLARWMWLEGSMKPIRINLPEDSLRDDLLYDVKAVFHEDRIDFSNGFEHFSIDCNFDDNVKSVNVRRISAATFDQGSHLTDIYPHEDRMYYEPFGNGHRLYSTISFNIMSYVLQAGSDFMQPHRSNLPIIAERKAKGLPPLRNQELPFGCDQGYNAGHKLMYSLIHSYSAKQYDLVLSRIIELLRGRLYTLESVREYIKSLVTGTIDLC